MQGLSVAVVGAGTAGLACALFLRRLGFSVRVLERVQSLQAVGAGVLLQPSGMAVLQKLGLLAECSRFGAPVSRLYGTTRKGRTILDTRYAHWKPGSFGMGMHRSVLLTVLRNALREAGVEVETGVEISRFSQQANCVQLFRADGQGAEQHVGDLSALILADGVRSVLRQQMKVKQWFEPYPWDALWSLVPTPINAASTELRQWYQGCSQMFGIMPTGRPYHAPEQALSSLFWSIPVTGFAHWREGGIDAWKADVLSLAGSAAEPYLEQISQPEQISQAVYADVRMQQWHDGRVLAVGDCSRYEPAAGAGREYGPGGCRCAGGLCCQASRDCSELAGDVCRIRSGAPYTSALLPSGQPAVNAVISVPHPKLGPGA